MSLTEMWQNVKGRLAAQRPVPANEVIPRMRESSGPFRALPAGPPPSLGEVTPFANEILAESAEPIPPPAWADVFPGHYKALIADLTKRGEDPARWEFEDGRDLGVSENGHTVGFVLRKTGTSATIQVELTLFKGQLSSIRVR